MTDDPASAPTPARWREIIAPPLATRVGLILLGVWLGAADTLVTTTIMPSVAGDLGGWAWFGWAVAGYLLGSIVAGASAGQVAARRGLRRSMIAAALVYAVGCALGAGAPSIGVFLVGRVMQGVGGGWIAGFCYVAIEAIFPERLWARVFGAIAGVWGVATLLGPLVGGLFAAAGHWRWAFWLFAAQGIAFAAAAFGLLRRTPAPAMAHRPLAWRTLAVIAAAVLAIGLADILPGPAWPGVLVAAGVAILILAARVNARPGEGLLPRAAGSPGTTAGAGYAMICLTQAAAEGFGVYGAMVLQTAHGASPLVAGYVVCADALGWTLAALVVSGQPDRRHPAFIITGASGIALGVVLLALTIGNGSIGLIAGAALILGVGFGLCWSLTTRRILAALPPCERAVGASAIPTAQLVGGAVGAAAAGAVANLIGLTRDISPVRVAALAPWLFAAFVPLAALGWGAALRLARPYPAAA